MPIIPNPQTQKWRAGLPGKSFGDIIQTWNIDLDKIEGKICTSERATILVDNSDANKIGTASATRHFLRTDADATDRWWALGSSGMLKTSTYAPVTGWANDGLANSPTDPSDMVTHETNNNNQRLLVTRTNGDISILNRSTANNVWTASWWNTTLGQTLMSTTYSHPIERLDRLVAIGDGEYIHTIDQSDIVAYKRLTFNSSYKCTAIYVSLTSFWFVLQNKFGGNGIVAEWDGGAEKANVIYEIKGNPIFGFIHKDTAHIVTDDGYINKYNGRGFSPIAQFPNREERLLLQEQSSFRNCAIEGDIINMAIMAPSNSQKMRSGVWAFNTESGNLYNRWGLGQYKLSVGTHRDYGQGYIYNIGGIVNTLTTGRFLIGATVYSDYPSGYLGGIYRLASNISNRGYFITSIIPSSEVEHYWYNIWIRFRKLFASSDSIVTKYRVSEGLLDPTLFPVAATATWASTTTFTAVVPTGVQVGHEVEVINGDNGGCSFNISALSATPDGVSTITVTVDEAVPQSSTGHSYVRFDDWKKITNNNPITTSLTNVTRTVNQTLDGPNVASGPYVQFKIELRGVLIEIDQIRVDAKIQTGANL